MVPQHTFPPGAERSGLPHLKVGRGGVVDTGYALPPRFQYARRSWSPVRPPGSSASAATGSRCTTSRRSLGRVDGDATLAALPDPLVGQRLIGNAADRNVMQAALGAVGVNPLVVAAFRDRSERDSASAERRE